MLRSLCCGLVATPSGQRVTPQQLAPLLPALQGLQLVQGLVRERLRVQGSGLLSPLPGRGAAGPPGWAQARLVALARPAHCMGRRGRHLSGWKGCGQKAGSQAFSDAPPAFRLAPLRQRA